jgi:magnesium transporter
MRNMGRFVKKRSKSIGLPPGSLVHIGEKKTDKVKITILDYDENTILEKEIEKVEDCFSYKNKKTITWVNVDGLHEVDVVEKIGTCYGLHPLVMEDIVNTGQRPKIEDFDNYIYFVLKMLHQPRDEIIAEQVSIIIGQNFVLSFQESEGDVFNAIRERIRNAKGRIRKKGADYLAYTLIDAIVDNYYVTLERFGEIIEGMEEEVVSEPTPRTLQTIHDLKREMIFLRKSVWPLREVINNIQRSESKLIQHTTEIYLRDVYDHTIQVIDTVETYRDMISGMLDVYLSSISNRMNEVMKVLTIFAAIFIPLTFIAGVYGMNFNPAASPFNMPELGWNWGYPFALFLMLVVGLVMVIYFRKKSWL